MADLRLFARRSFAVTGVVAFAISATVIPVSIPGLFHPADEGPDPAGSPR